MPQWQRALLQAKQSQANVRVTQLFGNPRLLLHQAPDAKAHEHLMGRCATGSVILSLRVIGQEPAWLQVKLAPPSYGGSIAADHPVSSAFEGRKADELCRAGG